MRTLWPVPNTSPAMGDTIKSAGCADARRLMEQRAPNITFVVLRRSKRWG